MLNQLAVVSINLQTRLTALLTFVFVVFASSASIAGNGIYKTINDGNWSNAPVWDKGDVAPVNITYNDEVTISHKISTGNLKINNGGTMIVKGNLTGQDLTMHGKDSKLIIEPGGSINFQNLSVDNNDDSRIIISEPTLTPLPVTLVFFDVKRNSGSAATTTLEWVTASEKNNAYFAVEKSLDGKTFTEAGRVTGKNAATGARYSFEDKNPASRAYYRLKQVDLDGTFTYSGIVVATTNLKLAVHGRNVIFDKNFNGKLHLVSTAGITVKTLELSDVATFELPESLKGIFILMVEQGNTVTTQRIRL